MSKFVDNTTGFETLTLRNQSPLIYAGSNCGYGLMPPHEFKLGARLEVGSAATVEVYTSSDNFVTKNLVATFDLDTPGEWVTTGRLVSDDLTIRGRVVESGVTVSLVIGG